MKSNGLNNRCERATSGEAKYGLNNRCERATSGEAKDDLNQPKTKTCKDCGNTYPVDYKHWRWKDYGYAIKPLPRCKMCHRKYEAQK